MELVYLWVEGYKNIHRQGFNFSSRFECTFYDKYDKDGKLEDDCELDICDKKGELAKKCENNNDYIENFFDEEGKINVTAIVGKNGSGKSSIIDLILKSVEEDGDINFIFVFEDVNKKPKYMSNISIQTDIKKSSELKNNKNIFVYNKSRHGHYILIDYTLVEINQQAIANILTVEYGKPNILFEISTFMYLPIKIEIKPREASELIESSIAFFPPKDRTEVSSIFNLLTDEYHQFLFICYGREKGFKYKKEVLADIKKLEDELKTFISKKEFFEYFRKPISENISDLTEIQKDIYIREKGYFHFFNFDLIDEKNRRFNHLSHGEQMIFGQLLNIYFFSNSQKNSFIFLFDEPEVALHPKWQKQYLNEVITLLKKADKKYHFIFTTHSPFLLSDLPKENVIFLDTDEQGNCKVIDGLKDKKQTFGANIHTLLSDGFFMDEGLMGEFAKGKINEIIEFHKEVKKENKKEISNLIPLKTEYEEKCKIKFWQTQSIIGEDYLKQVIKNHLRDIENILLGNDEAKNEEIKRLRLEADRLESMS